MIIYKSILARLVSAGYTTYLIRKEKILPESTMQKIRTDGTITTDTINTLCRLLDCQPGDLIEYVPDKE